MTTPPNPPRRVLRALRLRPGDPAAPQAARLWDQALALATPRTFAEEMAIAAFLERFAPHAEASTRLMRRLRGCDRVWVMAATLGPALEERAARLFAQGLAFDGYVLERMGTYLADKALRDLKAALCALGPCGPSYSPGYLDFSLEAQAPLVAMAQARLPQLALTTGFALLPAMSVTGVMGRIAPPEPGAACPDYAPATGRGDDPAENAAVKTPDGRR